MHTCSQYRILQVDTFYNFTASLSHDRIRLAILAHLFRAEVLIIVDTHVARLAQRFGWTHHEDITKIEQDLMKLLPREEWSELAHRIIYHGRAICMARQPLCAECKLARLCPSAKI